MKTSSFIKLLALLIIMATGITTSSFSQKPEQLYQQGLIKEEGEGSLQEAIDIYNKVAENTAAERSLRAKAQLHIGMCYEKLGLNQAQKAYQKVVDSYPEQTEAVKVANEKLSLLLKAQTIIETGDKEFKIRQVWSGWDVDILGAPSPDGKYLSFVDWDTGDLAIRDLASGKKRRLTNKGSWSKSPEYAEFSEWSPDSNQITYSWYNKDMFYELRVIGLDGSEPRILYRNEEMEYVEPADWSPDGKQILATTWRRKDGVCQIVLISVEEDSVRILKTLDQLYPSGAIFSSDGRYIVYGSPPKEDSPERDIFLLSIDGNHEICLVEHPADDFVLGWAPDGKSILFASDRTGTLDAWIIQVDHGKPRGYPELLKKGIGRISPMGFTRNGFFYYSVVNIMNDVYIARLDQETGKIHGQPMKATQRFEGANRSPAWSPDGKYLAYISYRGHSRMRRTVLCILSIESGKEHEPPVKLKEYYSPHWSHDGRSILVGDGGRTIFCINAKTGEAAPIIQIKEKESIHSPLYSPDGKLLYYVHNVKTENTYICRIMARDLKTGKDKELYRAPADDHTIALSRDGRWLALLNRAKKRILKVISTSGGEPHELYRFEQGKSWIISLAWTPDGRYILFSKQRPEPDSKWELWRIHAEGGKPQKLGLAMLGFDFLSVHPDGQRIAFSSSGFKMKPHEIWVMENFLPKEETDNK